MGVLRRDSSGANRSPDSLDGAGQTPTPQNTYKTLPDKNPQRVPPTEHGGIRFYPYREMRTGEYRRNRFKVLTRDKFTCVKCKSRLRPEVHHIVSFIISGDNSVNNLQVLCHKCNHAEKRFSRKMKWEQRVLYERSKLPPYV
jgi:5-methylcytosine-specific restriction protein A